MLLNLLALGGWGVWGYKTNKPLAAVGGYVVTAKAIGCVIPIAIFALVWSLLDTVYKEEDDRGD